MGYLHIDNLYKNQRILAFRECYALEKVHGTSAHITFRAPAPVELGVGGGLQFFSGGESHERFVSLFDVDALLGRFTQLGHPEVTVYGEAYGGKQQGMSHTYGKELRFIAFDVKVGESWLAVPDAADVVQILGLEFVPYELKPTILSALDALRDAPSEVAVRRGITEPKPREGIVLRPPYEVQTNDGRRIIAKHKGAAFAETEKPRKVVDPAQLEVLANAEAIAQEWVTEMRLTHVLDKIPGPHGLEKTGQVIKAMVEDVLREAAGEIVDSKDARRAIGNRAAQMFKSRVTAVPEPQC